MSGYFADDLFLCEIIPNEVAVIACCNEQVVLFTVYGPAGIAVMGVKFLV